MTKVIQTPSKLKDYLEANGVTFVVLCCPETDSAYCHDDWFDDLGPDVVTVTDKLMSFLCGVPECDDADKRLRAQEIDAVIQKSVEGFKARNDLSFTIFWCVEGSGVLHLEQHPQDDQHDCMVEILDFVHSELCCLLL